MDFLKKNDAPNALKAAEEASKGNEIAYALLKISLSIRFVAVQQQAASFCEQYSKVRGAGSPQRHPFFLQLDSLIRRVQSTVEFENNIMFVVALSDLVTFSSSSHHKRASAELAPLENNATHGILPAEEYIPAKLNSLFTADAYRAFDIGRNVGKVGRVFIRWCMTFLSYL